jgi:hypothetical protein
LSDMLGKDADGVPHWDRMVEQHRTEAGRMGAPRVKQPNGYIQAPQQETLLDRAPGTHALLNQRIVDRFPLRAGPALSSSTAASGPPASPGSRSASPSATAAVATPRGRPRSASPGQGRPASVPPARARATSVPPAQQGSPSAGQSRPRAASVTRGRPRSPPGRQGPAPLGWPRVPPVQPGPAALAGAQVGTTPASGTRRQRPPTTGRRTRRVARPPTSACPALTFLTAFPDLGQIVVHDDHARGEPDVGQRQPAQDAPRSALKGHWLAFARAILECV